MAQSTIRRWKAKTPDVQSCTAAAAKEAISVVWHKWSDLRLMDHEPLVTAHQRSKRVLHIHLVELSLLAGPSRVGKIKRCSPRRAAFWQEAVTDLSRRLEDRGQHLFVSAVSQPSEFFASLCERFNLDTVYAHSEFCDEEIQTEAQVRKTLEEHGAKLQTYWGALTVHHIDDLGFNARDPKEMPEFKGQFNSAAKRRPVREALDIPRFCPPPLLDENDYGPTAIRQAFSAGPEVKPMDSRQEFVWKGGESAALDHLKQYMESGQLVNYRGATESFAHGDHNPVNSGTRLSPWLAFGCLSARMVIQEARKFERKHGKSSSTGKGSGKMGSTGARLHTELLFRDFLRFSTLCWGTNLFKIGGPFKVSGIEWGYDKEAFAKWQAGQTGFPFVDAGMRELATTGYMSHLHRQCCAAFLVRDLRLDWRLGAEHFEACLLDHTPDANWGNWAYRILQRPCLVAPRAKYPLEEHITTMECVAWPTVHDAHFQHTRKWVPELDLLPLDLAKEPWRTESIPSKRIEVGPYKDSPLWFCAANRVNWSYEYFWLPGHAWTVTKSKIRGEKVEGFQIGKDYPYPVVPPLNVEIDLDALPVNYSWGDTDEKGRPHVWGTPGHAQGEPAKGTKGKGKRKRSEGPKAAALRDAAWNSHEMRERGGKGARTRTQGRYY